MWTKSACVLLAWSIVLIMTAAGLKEPARPAQANTRNASSTQAITVTSTLTAGTPFVVVAPIAAKTVRYVVRPGDTLSGIAARLGLPGGWPALYAASRTAIGPDPNLIYPGTVLTIPGRALARTPAPPAVHPGDRVRQPEPPTAHPGHRPHRPPPPSGSRHVRAPSATPVGMRAPAATPVGMRAPAATGMPAWLTAMLLAVAVLIGGAFLLHLVMSVDRRRRKAAARAAVREPGSRSPADDRARIVLADHDRLIVTRSRADDTIYVLRPPGSDPAAILRVARLVLAEGSYQDLAEHLGLPASWTLE